MSKMMFPEAAYYIVSTFKTALELKDYFMEKYKTALSDLPVALVIREAALKEKYVCEIDSSTVFEINEYDERNLGEDDMDADSLIDNILGEGEAYVLELKFVSMGREAIQNVEITDILMCCGNEKLIREIGGSEFYIHTANITQPSNFAVTDDENGTVANILREDCTALKVLSDKDDYFILQLKMNIHTAEGYLYQKSLICDLKKKDGNTFEVTQCGFTK